MAPPADGSGGAADAIGSAGGASAQPRGADTAAADAGAAAAGSASADPQWGARPYGDGGEPVAFAFGEQPSATMEEEDMWGGCGQTDGEARAPPYCESVGEYWDEYRAAGTAGDEAEMKRAAEKVAKGFLSFVLSNRKGGMLWRKARRAQKKAGIKPADFDVSLNGREDGDGSIEDVDAEEETQASHYGETMLQAMLSSQRQADVPGEGDVSYADAEREVAAMAARLEALEPGSASVIAEELCMAALPGVLLLMVDAAEAARGDLRAQGQRVLRFLGEHAKPREVHVMVKDALSRVSPRYKTAVLRLISVELVMLWGLAIPKITGKRLPFLTDLSGVLLVTVFDPNANSHGDGGAADEVASKRRPTPEEVALFQCLQPLAADLREKAEERRHGDEVKRHAQLAEVVVECAESDDADVNWTDFDIVPEAIVAFFRKGPPRFAATAVGGSALELTAEQAAEEDEWNKRKVEYIAELRKIVDEQEQSFDDFQTERGHVLSLLLKLVEVVASRLFVPIFDRNGLITNVGGADSALVTFLKETMPIFKDCGFDNPVDACQQGVAALGLSPISDNSGFTADVSRPKPRRERKPGTYFTSRSLGCYLMAVLGCGKCKLDADKVMSEAGFGLLNSVYAVELTLPILLALFSDRGSPALRVFAAQLLNSLVCNVSEGLVATKADATRYVYHVQFAGGDGSWNGLVHALALAVPDFSEKNERAMMYGVLKTLLKRFRPTVRYAILEAVLMKTQHHIMVSQLITELKNAMNAIDLESCQEGTETTKETAESYISRFVNVVLKRFLLPRKEFLSSLASVSTAANAAYFIAMCDRRKVRAGGGCTLLRARLQSLKDTLELAKQALVATADIIQVDKRATGYDTVGKEADAPEKQELAENAARDMRTAQEALVAIDSALDVIRDCSDSKEQT